MTDMDVLAPQKVEQTLYALIATWLALGSRNYPADFASIRKNNSGLRAFEFENYTFSGPDGPLAIVTRADGDEFITPGVNIYFGPHVSDKRNAKPQITHLSLFIHAMVKWTTQKYVADQQADRLVFQMEQAFEGSKGAFAPVYDFTASPPVPTVNRFVSWVRRRRGDSKEAGDPNREEFTNRIWTREFRYTR